MQQLVSPGPRHFGDRMWPQFQVSFVAYREVAVSKMVTVCWDRSGKPFMMTEVSGKENTIFMIVIAGPAVSGILEALRYVRRAAFLTVTGWLNIQCFRFVQEKRHRNQRRPHHAGDDRLSEAGPVRATGQAAAHVGTNARRSQETATIEELSALQEGAQDHRGDVQRDLQQREHQHQHVDEPHRYAPPPPPPPLHW